MAIQLRIRTFLACENCDKLYGGPNAGEYDYRELSDNMTIQEFLLSEALMDAWIKVTYGKMEVLLCSSDCVKNWLDTMAKAQG